MKRPESPKTRKKASAMDKIAHAALLLALAYTLCAIVPYAFPPSAVLPADGWTDDPALTTDFNCDSARIAETGDEALDARLAVIAGAKSTLRAAAYLFSDDESGEKIAAALLAAARRGVRVQLLIDGLIGPVNIKNAPFFYALCSQPNVEVRWYNAFSLLHPDSLNARLHEKYLIADEEWIILGGRNISDEFLTPESDEAYNYDQDVILHLEKADARGAAKLAAEYFDYLWESEGDPTRFSVTPASMKTRADEAGEALTRLWEETLLPRAEAFDLYADLTPVEKTVLMTNPISPRAREPLLFSKLVSLMLSAREDVTLLTPYLILNGDMRNALAQAASGPSRFSILINSRETGNNVIASADGVLALGMADALDADVYEFNGGRSMHTKCLLIDDDLTVFGSFNFDMRSAYIDTEIMLAVYSEQINSAARAYAGQMLESSCRVYTADAETEDLSSSAPRQEASFFKMAMIYLLSPFVFLFRFLA